MEIEVQATTNAKTLSRRPTSAGCAMIVAPTPTDRQLKIAKMLALAEECGFSCEAHTTYHTELAAKIACHLVHRSGMDVYQSVSFVIPLFSRAAALNTFGIATGSVVSSQEHCLHWKFQTVTECAHVLKPLLATLPSSSCVEGMCRALLAGSEVTSLVVAMVMPTLEVKWTRMPNGAGHLKTNFYYMLMDVDGEVHPPKDEDRRELAIGAALELAMRQRVLLDVQRMIDRGLPMASG